MDKKVKFCLGSEENPLETKNNDQQTEIPLRSSLEGNPEEGDFFYAARGGGTGRLNAAPVTDFPALPEQRCQNLVDKSLLKRL